MKKETLEEMQRRHSQEITDFQKNCQHKKVILLETSVAAGGMKSPVHENHENYIINHKTEEDNKYKLAGYECVLVKCADCGTPLVSIDHGKISLYKSPHYVSNDVVIPKKHMI